MSSSSSSSFATFFASPLLLLLLIFSSTFFLQEASGGSCALSRQHTVFLSAPEGSISDGSPETELYLTQEHECRWKITAAGEEENEEDDDNASSEQKEEKKTTRITLALEYFNSVLGEDFLRVYDENEEEILATYSGDVFPHSIAFKNQSSLTVEWKSLNLNRDKGFRVHYFTDRMDGVKCLNDCDRVGVCTEANVCRCPKGRAGADCSIVVHQLVMEKKENDTDGSTRRFQGYSLLRSEPGECAYLNVDVPKESLSGDDVSFMRVEATFPDGLDGDARPSLFISNALDMNGTNFYVPSSGYCETEPRGCEWIDEDETTKKEEKKSGSSSLSAGDEHIAFRDYSLLLSTPEKEKEDTNATQFTVTAPQIPTFHYYNKFDMKSYSVLSPIHSLRVDNVSSDSRFIIAVCNIRTPLLPLAFKTHELQKFIPEEMGNMYGGSGGGIQFWSSVASKEPKTDVVSLVKVVLSNETKDSCVTDCNNNRSRCSAMGTCLCERPYAGTYCESKMKIIEPDGVVHTFSETLDKGGSAKMYISIPERPSDSDGINAIKIEISHENNPSALGTVLVRRDTNVSSEFSDNVSDRVVVCAAWPHEELYHGETRCLSFGYVADYAANTEGATSQQELQFVNTLSSVASDYARLEIPIESVFEGSSNAATQNVSAGYYVTVINHHAISGERMSFDARVSFEYEDYSVMNEKMPTCPFNCSNHGICVNVGFFRGMCVCFKGYAGLYCQNNATKLAANEQSVVERNISPGDWEYFYVEGGNSNPSASAILSVQVINYEDVNGIPELFGKRVASPAFVHGASTDDGNTKIMFETPVPVKYIHSDFTNTSVFTLNSSLVSSGPIGDEANSFLSFQDDFKIPRNASISDISWKTLRIDATPPSYLSEACLAAYSAEERNYFAYSKCPSLTPASGRELVIDGSLKTPGLIQDGKNAGIELFESVDDDDLGVFDGSSKDDKTSFEDANWVSGEIVITWRAFVRTGYDVESVAQTQCTRIDCIVPEYLFANFTVYPNETWSFGVRSAKIRQSYTAIEPSGGSRFEGSEKDLHIKVSLLLTESGGIDSSKLCVANCSGIGRCVNGVCACPLNLTGVACSIPIELLTLEDTLIEKNGTSLVISENVTDVRVLPEGAFDVYRFRVANDTSIVRATLDHALHHGSSPRLFLRRNAVPIYCPPGLRGGFLNDGDGEVNQNLYAGDGDICRDAYDAFDALETRDESSGKLPEAKIIPNKTRNSTDDADIDDGDDYHPFGEEEKYLVQHEASVKVADVPRRYNVSGWSIGSEEDEEESADWWFLTVFNDAIGASESLIYRVSIQTLPSYGWCQKECKNNGVCDKLKGICECSKDFIGDACEIPLISIENGETKKYEDRLDSGQAVAFSFEIRCQNQKFALDVEKLNDYSAFANSGPELYFGLSRGDVPKFDSKRGVWKSDLFETIPNVDVSGTLGYYLRGETSAPVGKYFAIVAVDFGHSALMNGVAAKLSIFGSDIPNESETNQSSNCLYPSGTLGVNVKDEVEENKDSVILDVYELDYGPDCNCYMASVKKSTTARGFESITADIVFPKARPSSFTLPFYYLRNDVRKYAGTAPNEEANVEYQSPDPRTALASNDIVPDAWDREGCNAYISDDVEGKICIVVRGGCPFDEKTLNCQNAGGVGLLIVNVDTYGSRIPAPAADNWRSFPQNKITIPTFSIGQVDGDTLLEKYTRESALQPDDATESRTLLEMFSYICKLPYCKTCAFGLGNPSDNCTQNKCPGLDPTFSVACNGRGVCTEETSFRCDCEEGYEGESCEKFANPPVFTRVPAVDIALELASNEIASFTFGASLSNATTEKMDNDIKFRVVNARSVRAASIDTNTGAFLFDATKIITTTDAQQQQKKEIDVTIEAIDPRGESAQISFPVLVSNVPNVAGNTEIQRIAAGGWTIRTLGEKSTTASSKEERGDGENVEKSASADDDNNDESKKEDVKLEKSFGFLFFVSMFGLVLFGLLGFKLLKLRNRNLHRRGLRHVELPEWNATDDVETLRSRYFESNTDEVRTIA